MRFHAQFCHHVGRHPAWPVKPDVALAPRGFEHHRCGAGPVDHSAFIFSSRTLAVRAFKTSFAIRARRKKSSPPLASPEPRSVPAPRSVSASARIAACGTGLVAAARAVPAAVSAPIWRACSPRCLAADIAHMTAHLSGACEVIPVTDRGLLALQGPLAEAALARLVPGVAAMRFMDVVVLGWGGVDLWISRSGYTGEDGFEISVPDAQAEDLAMALLDQPEVMPIGLGARDSLRLEAGLCLYGHDIDQTTSPVEAGLTWAIQKARRAGGDRAGGFPGEARILQELAEGAERRRVGLRPDGRAPMREAVEIFAADATPVGHVTSGGFGPSVAAPIAMGYVATAYAGLGTLLDGDVRGKRLPVKVAAMPFHPTNYKR